MARVWNGPVFIVAALYFVVDGMFSYVTQPITVLIAKLRLSIACDVGSSLWVLIHRWLFSPCRSSSWNQQSHWPGT